MVGYVPPVLFAGSGFGLPTLWHKVGHPWEARTDVSVHIYAIDQNGNVLVDDTVVNGQRQKTKCCG